MVEASQESCVEGLGYRPPVFRMCFPSCCDESPAYEIRENTVGILMFWQLELGETELDILYISDIYLSKRSTGSFSTTPGSKVCSF